MSDDKQRIAIAEARGWQDISSEYLGSIKGSDPKWRERYPSHRNQLPDYLNDLNACHEMEQWLVGDSAAQIYYERLADVTGARMYRPDGSEHGVNHFRMYSATAKQRCEAFLRTIGRWEDE